MIRTPAQLVRVVGSWPVRSQEAARRNALVASTALTARRRERDEVEEFLARREVTWSRSTHAASVERPA